MPPKVVVNGRFLVQPLSGMQRFAEELLTALDHLLDSDPALLESIGAPVVMVPPGDARSPPWRHLQIVQVGRHKGHLWEQVDLAIAARNSLLLNLTASGPLLHSRSVLVLHDAAIFAHPEHFSRKYLLWHRFLRPRIANRALKLGTVSHFSKSELAKWCKVPESKFVVLYDSAEHILECTPEPEVINRNGLESGRFALTVGNQSPNKNIPLAVQAFLNAAPPEWKLAVVGGGANNVFGETVNINSNRVVRLGRISDGELRALYESAGLFLFPSRYEGFGVPPLEAMSLGCPVVSSDSSAMPEVLGNAAAYFPSNDIDSFSNRIQELTAPLAPTDQFRKEGHLRAKKYTWANSAAELANLLRSMCVERT
ncbi:glycosyltransferase family 4 protein [Hydrogenophaga sp. ZJX-1]|uniref:glycosyltransferase family 4 protein n=1 Tax=Hydrogenophaga sp. ZJX-1 TaxID=3404778 RepID=UPI003B287702